MQWMESMVQPIGRQWFQESQSAMPAAGTHLFCSQSPTQGHNPPACRVTVACDWPDLDCICYRRADDWRILQSLTGLTFLVVGGKDAGWRPVDSALQVTHTIDKEATGSVQGVSNRDSAALAMPQRCHLS